MLNKKFFVNILTFLICLVLVACGSSSARTSNVKQVIESRSRDESVAAQDTPQNFTAPSNIVAQSNITAPSNKSIGNPSSLKPKKEIKVDLDLTSLNSILADAELRNLQDNRDEARGLVVKAKGEYQCYTDETTGNTYYNCIFASACCPNGLEFILDDSTKYPKNDGEIITVVGQFNYYIENDIIYYNLINAEIV